MEEHHNSGRQEVKRHRVVKVAVLTLLGCGFVLFSLVMVDAAFKPYRRALGQIAELEGKVQGLSQSSHRELRIRTESLHISTTDKPETNYLRGLRLVYGTNGVQRFEESIFKETGKIKWLWVSDWEPRSEMGKFEQFSVYPSTNNSWFEIVAKTRPSESIDMQFTVTCLVEE